MCISVYTWISQRPDEFFATSTQKVSEPGLPQVLELLARERTGDAIRALLDLAPKTARRILLDGTEYDAPLENIMEGDRLRVRPGDAFPVDGTVIEGRSSLDEAIVEGAEAQGATRQDAADFDAVTGKGVRGRVGGRAVALGNAAMMREIGAGHGCRRSQGTLLEAGGRVVTIWECALRKPEQTAAAVDRLSTWLLTETDTLELGEREIVVTPRENRDVSSSG